MSAKIYYISPKGSAWLIYCRHWKGGSCTTAWAFVFNRTHGLTAIEAWQEANLAGNPPFSEVVATQLSPFSSASVNTNQEALKAKAFDALRMLSECSLEQAAQ